eukprot:CAMPEP_0182567928 /NCGR_PEP_ID=MMETSP1324-20130603/9021_1 /TAXON_ID=236786 /ORGANISM="Florenciella sp., Strain RCC1587" /LENGTH=37 /DNA_ID= /DNA_START= /DNA_END= /DNA_ORIENTATION=
MVTSPRSFKNSHCVALGERKDAAVMSIVDAAETRVAV